MHNFKQKLKGCSFFNVNYTPQHAVVCKLLQQRLMPIDKMIEKYNQSSETREGKLKKVKYACLFLNTLFTYFTGAPYTFHVIVK